MFIGHAPSGYIVASLLLKRLSNSSVPVKALIATGILGALAPDLDMIYFYLVDHRQHHHHTYVSHWPILWFGMMAASIAWMKSSRRSRHAVLAFLFCLAAVVHIILDSVVGDIWWFAPFIDQPFALFTVPAIYKPWWLNFIFHWSFALELALCLWMLLIYQKRAKSEMNGLADGAEGSETA